MQRNQIIALILVAALVLVGCAGAIVALVASGPGETGEQATATRTPSPASTGEVSSDGVPEELLPFYEQTLDWSSCSGGNECAELEVPIDYSDVETGTVMIALERAAARGERIGSMVVNPGGPGAPGTDMATNVGSYFTEELRSSYDIVGFDPRGTGDSDPIDCLSDAELDEYVAGDPSPDDRAEQREFEASLADFWAGCEANSGEVAAHTSTVEVARDMDVLRAVLGEEKLTYFGFSYGTRLGAHYAELFPDNVGRFVLDGAVDPSISALDGSLSQAEGFETALRSYIGNCVDAGNCFLGDSVEAGLDTITGLLDNIEASPLPTDEERDLEVGTAFYGLIAPLYSEVNWPYLDQGLQEALEGDGTILLFLSDFYGSRENGAYTDNGLEAISVINCLDDSFAFTPAQVTKNLSRFLQASPTFGEVFAWGMLGCRDTPFTATDEPDLQIDGSGAAPIVVIGTTRDPATPYDEAVAMAEQLESGVLLSRDGDGHTAYNRGNACIDDTVHAYLIEGIVPKDGKEC